MFWMSWSVKVVLKDMFKISLTLKITDTPSILSLSLWNSNRAGWKKQIGQQAYRHDCDQAGGTEGMQEWLDAGTCNQKCIELLFRLRLPIVIIDQSPLPLLFLSLSPWNSTYPSLASCTRMIIHLSIDHLHLSCHLVQSFSEFGVVLPISHCHCTSQRWDAPSRKIVEPWKRVHLSISLFSLQLQRRHTGNSICQLSLCPSQFPTHLEPLDSLVDLSLL